MSRLQTLLAFLFIFLAMPALNVSVVTADELPSPIVMFWQVQNDVTDGELRMFSEAGVTTIQSFNIVRWSNDEIEKYLDNARKYDLGVIIYLGNLFNKDSKELSQEGIDFIKKWKSHPAIFAWHLFDEPKESKKRFYKSQQAQAYKTVKSLDPERLVMISINYLWQKDYDEFFNEDAFDILDLHTYVDPSISWRQKRLIKLFKKNRRGEYPVIITMRAFNGPGWNDLKPGSIDERYDFFFGSHEITQNIAFYGWGLSAFRGMKESPSIKSEVLDIVRKVSDK